MEKITIQFKPEIGDYHKVTRSYLTRKRIYWLFLGIYIACTLAIIFLTILSILGGGTLRSAIIYFGPIVLFFVFLTFLPVISGWLTVRSAVKKEHLTIPVTYEIDGEKVRVSNALADVIYSWDVFSHAYENETYFFLTHSSNLNMFQFIPKHAFSSVNEEAFVRSIAVEKFGKVENIRSGLTGWKLTFLVVFLITLLLACVGVGLIINIYFFDGTSLSPIVV